MAKYKTRKEAQDAGEDWYGIMPITDKGFAELKEMQDKMIPYTAKKLDLSWLKDWAKK